MLAQGWKCLLDTVLLKFSIGLGKNESPYCKNNIVEI